MTKERQGLRLVEVVNDSAGAALVEFVFVLPALLLLIFGIIQLGLVAYNYIMVTNAAVVGSRTFSYGRGYGPTGTPYTTAVAAIQSASSFTANELANLTATFEVCTTVASGSCSAWTTPCTSDSTCYSDLETAWAQGKTPPLPVNVTVQYSCAGAISIMPTYLINLTGFCPMTSTMLQPVQ